MFARNNIFENANGTGIFEPEDLAAEVLIYGRDPRVAGSRPLFRDGPKETAVQGFQLVDVPSGERCDLINL